MDGSNGFSKRDDDARRLVNADPATVLNAIKASNYGEHNLVVYPCLEQFEEFYIESCKDSILERNELFILVTCYQQVSAVRKKLHQAGIDVARYENDGILLILDSEAAYRPASEEAGKYRINNLTEMMAPQVRGHHKEGVTILADLGIFVLKKRIADLLLYELSMPMRFNSNIRPFCFYHKDDFNVLQEEERERICSHHLNNLIVS